MTSIKLYSTYSNMPKTVFRLYNTGSYRPLNSPAFHFELLHMPKTVMSVYYGV